LGFDGSHRTSLVGGAISTNDGVLSGAWTVAASFARNAG
jgi:hypothetical protein